MQAIRLSQLKSALDGDLLIDWQSPGHDPWIKHVHLDSRKVKQGDLFVAVPGLNLDGHQFIDDALHRGAAAVAGEHPREALPAYDHTIPYLKVRNSRRAVSRLAAARYRHPSKHLTVIGVTGTNGKTTTTHMVAAIARAAGHKTGVIGTVGNWIGDQYEPAKITTPDAPELQSLLAQMREAGCTVVAMEVSSHALALARTDDVDFDVGLITNLSEDHLDFHQTRSAYFEAKGRLFEQLSPPAVAVYNENDPQAARLVRSRSNSRKRLGFGINSTVPADVSSSQLQLKMDETQMALNCEPPNWLDRTPWKDQPLSLPLPGIHNVENALAAAATAYALNWPLRAVTSGLKSVKRVKRRLEIIHPGQPLIIDDFAHNPAGLSRTLKAINTVQAPDRWTAVYALRGNRGADINRSNATVLANWLKADSRHRLIATESRFDVDQKDRVSKVERTAFELAFREAGISPPPVIPDLTRALKEALGLAQSSGAIILLGAQGMDPAAEILQSLLPQQGNLNQPTAHVE